MTPAATTTPGAAPKDFIYRRATPLNWTSRAPAVSLDETGPGPGMTGKDSNA